MPNTDNASRQIVKTKLRPGVAGKCVGCKSTIEPGNDLLLVPAEWLVPELPSGLRAEYVFCGACQTPTGPQAAST